MRFVLYDTVSFMNITNTLDSVVYTFQVHHSESLRGTVRRFMIFALLVFIIIFSMWSAVVMLPRLVDWGLTWAVLAGCAGLCYMAVPYLSPDCELSFSSARVSFLDRGQRRSFPLESITEARYHRKALQLHVNGVAHLMFLDISSQDASTLIGALKDHRQQYLDRMQAAGHDLSRPAALPPELQALTERSGRKG